MKFREFKNVSAVSLLGIEPGKTGRLAVGDDGLLTDAHQRQLVKMGRLVEVAKKTAETKPQKVEVK